MLQSSPPRTREGQIAWEVHRRARIAVPAVAAGVLYELSSVTLSAVLKNAPTVGALQAIAPALTGKANPTVSPRAPEVRYLSHHAFGTIASAVMAALALVFLALALAFLYDATRFRRPRTWAPARGLVLFGGIAFAVLGVAQAVIAAITTHKFAVGHDFSNHAADQAIVGTAQQIVLIARTAASLALAVGVGVVSINAGRVGLLKRPFAYSGVVVAALFVLQGLQVIAALWMLALGILLLGRWPGGDPPAWEAGEARPWPTAAEQQAARAAAKGEAPLRGGGRGGRRGATPPSATSKAPAPQPGATATEAPPEPTRPAHPSSAKRKRKRGARR